MGARANAGVVAIAPVGKIMTTFCPGSGMVGYLIGRHAETFRDLLRRFVKHGGMLTIRDDQLAGLV
ncbi:hypothetical protein D3C87_2057660 [compost metagenome]